LGLLAFLRGVLSFLIGLKAATSATKLPRGYSWKDYVKAGVMYLMIGVLLLACAEPIARMFYGRD
jgi:hypothetical protein